MRLGIPEFTVNMKVQRSYPCPQCDGTGQKRREFRNKIFITKCKKCHGEGRLINTVTTEIPLTEALDQMGFEIINKSK